MPRSRSSSPSRGYHQSVGARRARRIQRTAIIAIALGCLLAVTTGVVRAQVGDSAGAQAIGAASALGVAGEEQQVVACKITVPPHALTAAGLATPWVLSGDKGGKCEETTADQAAFIDATIFDPAAGKVSIYRPLVVTEGTTAAVEPVPPPVPGGAVVEISVGFNGDELTLTDAHNGRDITGAHCVNGLRGSIFGQEIFCNARAFYTAANGKVTFTPPLGTSPDDGRPCPTTESWEIVDQDQSDNTTTSYVVQGNQTAQSTTANQQKLGSDLIGNGSDNNLYTKFYAPAVHCQPPQAPDLTDPGAPVQSTSSALLNLYARAAHSPTPALVPMGDPFTLVNGEPSLQKTNLYRAQVDQPRAARAADASTAAYCRHLLDLGLTKIELDKALLQALGRSPDPGVSDDLHLFVLNRFKESWDNLACEDATGTANPVAVSTDADAHVVSAQVTLPTGTTTTTSAAAEPTTTTTTTVAAAEPTTTTGAAAEPTTTTTSAAAAGPTTTTTVAAAEPTTTTTTAAAGPAATTVELVSAGGPATTAAPTDAAAPTSTAGRQTMVMAVTSTSGPPRTTAEAGSSAPVPGLAEQAQPSGTDTVMASNARPAGTLPFTGLDSRMLLLAAAALMCAGGWLLVWAGRVKRRQQPV